MSQNPEPTVHSPGQAGYDRARRRLVWQARLPDRYPSEILEVSRETEVGAVVRRVAAAGGKMAVMSSGHSYCASGLQQDRVLLDLTRLRRVEIRPEDAVAHVQVGATNGCLDTALEAHGLAFPIGHSPSVALGGYLLGGGLGWNSEAWGQAACFSVLAADVVLADGDCVRVSERDEPELFWALRGAGPLFPGVVTRYSLALQPRPEVAQASRSYALGASDELSRWIVECLPDKNVNLELSASFETVRDRSGLERRAITLNAVSFSGDAAEAEEQLRQLTRSWPSTGVLSALKHERTSFSRLLAQNDVRPDRHAVETAWTDEIEATLGILTPSFAECASPLSSMHVSFRTNPDLVSEGAYSLSARALVFCAGVWTDSREDGSEAAWVDSVVARLAPITLGRYVNETNYVDHPEQLRASFTPEAFERIQQVCARYDPAGRFAFPY